MSHYSLCPTIHFVPRWIVSHYTLCPTIHCIPLYILSHYALCPTIHCIPLSLCPTIHCVPFSLCPTIHCIPLYIVSHFTCCPTMHCFPWTIHFVPIYILSHYAMCPTIHFVPLSLCPPMHCVPLYIVNRECPPLNEGLLEITTKVQLRSSLSWCWTCTARYRSSSSFILSMGSLSAVSTGKNLKGVLNVISSFSDKKNKQCLDFLSGIWRRGGRGGGLSTTVI